MTCESTNKTKAKIVKLATHSVEDQYFQVPQRITIFLFTRSIDTAIANCYADKKTMLV